MVLDLFSICGLKRVFDTHIKKTLATQSKIHVYLMLGVSHVKSVPCLVWFHGSFASEDIKFLIFQVILQNHVIERPCAFMVRSSSQYFTIMTSLVVIVIVEIYCFFVASNFKHGGMFKGLFEIMGGNLSCKSPPSNIGGHWASTSKDINHLI